MEKNEKLEAIKEFFAESNIEIPIAVLNSIEDVFDENDELESVDIYLKNDLEEFSKDSFIENTINISIDNISTGCYHSTYTYYGILNFAIKEQNLLVKNGEVIEVINDFDNQQNGEIDFKHEDWALYLLETAEFKDGELTQKYDLKIYCPELGESENE